LRAADTAKPAHAAVVTGRAVMAHATAFAVQLNHSVLPGPAGPVDAMPVFGRVFPSTTAVAGRLGGLSRNVRS
jgi:hypothetical protein